jgi:predicted nucleotide-binding protein (sugar kinase/HSP70/actin superfamily)
MKVAFPHIGYVYVNLGALIRRLGLEVVVPPRPSYYSLVEGAKHAPEQACVPFKANLGDLIQALRMGADALAGIQGMWSCRFGYYSRLHHLILRDLGYEFESIILDGSKEGIRTVEKNVRKANNCGLARAVHMFSHAFRFAYLKGKAVEDLVDRTRWLRPREEERGIADRLLKKGIGMIDRAESASSLKAARREIMMELDEVPVRKGFMPLRVILVGEVYIVLEPLLNFGIERKLGDMGVEVHSYISEHKWLIHPFGLGRKGTYGENRAHQLATPYLKYNVGGEDKNTVGFYLIAKERGFDGVVHFKPFTCMPEIVAKTVLYRVADEEGTPFISFTVDEHTGEEGVRTRLEAFVDMLEARKSAKCVAI